VQAEVARVVVVVTEGEEEEKKKKNREQRTEKKWNSSFCPICSILCVCVPYLLYPVCVCALSALAALSIFSCLIFVDHKNEVHWSVSFKPFFFLLHLLSSSSSFFFLI
jgi:hypothetical protein